MARYADLPGHNLDREVRDIEDGRDPTAGLNT